jgi:hypothetical protein
MGKSEGVYTVLVRETLGKRPLGRLTSRWEDNIKMDLGEIGWGAWTGPILLWIGTGGWLL